jgi:hypothetical protein
MVRNNLKSSDCFDAMGQLKINVDDGFTYYNYSYNLLFVNIARENKDFNLTGITISFGDGSNSQSVTIINGVVNGVYPANVTLTPGQILSLPSLAGSSTYVINVPTFSSSLGNITTVSIYPLLTNNVRCDKADEATVPLK